MRRAPYLRPQSELNIRRTTEAADLEQLALLRRGPMLWNEWRQRNTYAALKLCEAELSDAALSGANLTSVNLTKANLARADLREADLRGADLALANLANADLSHADLSGANLAGANLSEANLGHAFLTTASLVRANLCFADSRKAYFSSADLFWADLRQVNFAMADLSGVSLARANLGGANLGEAQLKGAEFSETVFSNTNLKDARGLDDCRHAGPSTIDGRTIAKSGSLPRHFLRGCGFADWEIINAKLYDPHLTAEQIAEIQNDVFQRRAISPIQISPIFISYSHKDMSFVEGLERMFEASGIRSWRDVHGLKAGRVERQIERAITLNPTVLIVLSEHSVESDWVEWEVSKARELEKQLNRDVLCPIALDASWKTSSWPGPLRRQIEHYHILDFKTWRDETALNGQFARLIDGLQLFYRRTTG